jgi:wobble nucleotide-excising tRNase
MKIKKIDINNFGSYKNYTWINKDIEFKDVNIIYGRNYSGKTTLSRIFKCLENKNLHRDYENPNFSFTLENNSVINIDNISINSIDICVYNTDFVKENLNWLHNDNGTIEPFTILGETNIEIEVNINKIATQLGDKLNEEKEKFNKGLYFSLSELENKFKEEDSKYKKINLELENKLKNKANQEIKPNPLYKNVNYKITNIQNDIKKIKNESFELLSDEVIETYKNLIKENIKDDIKYLPEQKPNFEKLFKEVNEILSKIIKPSIPIQDLLNDSLLQEWVRQGSNLHKEKRETCAFCGNVIDENLWKKLDEHFSKESEELRVEITNKINELNTKKTALESFIKFDENSFYNSFQKDVISKLKNWKDLKSKYENNIDLLINNLDKRLKDIFNIINMNEIEDISNEILDFFREINSLIEKNNSKTSTLNKEQEDAREFLRLNEVAKFINDIDYDNKIKEISDMKLIKDDSDKRVKDKEDEIKKLEEEIRVLRTELQDESRGAELVNEYLEKYFGNNGFKLSSNDDGEGVKYKILRNEIEARNLSEGECSLISFCYFMAKIKDKLEDEINPNRLIIYIDDPISSLDSNHIFFIFSLIEHKITKQKKYKQLFISTHNLDFLKYIKRLTLAGKSDDTLRHFLIEMEQKQNDKKSNFAVMPNHLKDYTTEFNYLFHEIYKLYKEVKGDRTRIIENTYNQFYNIPNNIRKFLEYYLFYKYPNTDSPLNNLDKLFENEVPTKINRLVNELSHLTFIDRGWSPMDVSEIEECVKIVIEKIKEKDEEQFDALVQSLGK